MKQRIQTAVRILFLAAAVLLAASGCTLLGIGSGTVNLSLTDAPVDADNVEGVYITVTGLEYNKSAREGESGWAEFPDFTPMTEPFNLLDLTEGATELLGNFELTAGQYNQIRLQLDLAETGSYVRIDNGDGTYTNYGITAPSVAQTGFKLVNAFTVPYNGAVNLVIDWDVRKGLVHNANGYTLRPTMRLIAEDEAGQINVTIENTSGYSDLVVFAYEDDTYSESEAAAPESDEVSRFENAVTSAVVNEENKYVLPFLAPGTYDLVVAGYTDDVFGEVLTAQEDVDVDGTGAETVTITLE